MITEYEQELSHPHGYDKLPGVNELAGFTEQQPVGLAAMIQRLRGIRDEEAQYRLRDDRMQHLWHRKGDEDGDEESRLIKPD